MDQKLVYFNFGVRFIGEDNVNIGFTIFSNGVITGLICFDEVSLGNNGFKIVVNDFKI
ncbi:MAG: hypothetical protein UV28_C0013G0005 [Candidatus Collierbacteria bacterium GW2011_GWE2_42_48]|nr:MAG: hypothetical protein UV28_C0013G0005 [Candidatus Collierbacteria bacterium GW2011_GWE2_42_48]